MAGIDDHARHPRGMEQPFLLVEVPAARLLRKEPPLEPVGEARDDILQTAHLLIEISAKPPELLLVAQLLRLDDLVEAGGEGLVIGLRRQLPIAPAGRSEHALAQVVAGCRFLFAGIHLLAAALGRSVLGFLTPHLDVAAAGSALLALLGHVLASALVTFLLLAPFLRFFLERLLGG